MSRAGQFQAADNAVLPAGQQRYPWYAIHVQSKFEALVSATLRGKGYEEFLPLYRSARRWSDRVKYLGLPLFSGYLFCRLDINSRLLPVLTTPGVLEIVGAGKAPVSVSENEINVIQTVVRSGLPAQPCPFLNVGCRASIDCGPLAGMEGIVTGAGKESRLVISVFLLQRSVAVEIDSAWVRPISDAEFTAQVPDSR
jgi:transcription antitermination factor NusG